MNPLFFPARLRAPLDALARRIDALPPLPAAWAGPQTRVAGWLRHLPSRPPSQGLAVLLNQGLWPRLPEELRQGLQGRVIALEVSDLGWRLRLRGRAGGFDAAGDERETALRIAARAAGWWRLARGLDDPDRLFFDRVLVMEGDTELGLLLKNSLDALGPVWPVRPTAPSSARG
ncbi:sterol-binding protein [Ideonella dechloratans]|uniref:Sterol-binding protein n=1 Tax=Ideonella dechloratans TaxID=36863 RepID=A0A643F649_IDEDE|nr:SCP2 sterol-binding domain-containing protein [Ideonella dechloratans]KAB0573840.1 sterol-binding protein [Ideonella dechloratans]UFU12408.1 SCP2 sterol-binding domain-containing protein [Ideonella dechloratans]